MHFQIVFLTTFIYFGLTQANVDIIIVGAGTAGCALAAKLCVALPTFTITLLERGTPRNETGDFIASAPRNIFAAWDSTSLNEIFLTEPDVGMANRPSEVVTGDTLGGSSTVNGLQWTIPLKKAKELKITGLTEAKAQAFYQTAFNQLKINEPPPEFSQIYTDEYLTASDQAGFNLDHGPFDRTIELAAWPNRIATDENARRQDSCTAYLDPVIQTCQNLQLIQDVVVTRVLLSDDEVPRATGVEYVNRNDVLLSNPMNLMANKEVILSAGPFGSPKILQLSGIGPEEALENAGIELKVRSNVGKKTQGRVFTPFISLYSQPLEPANNSTIVESAEERMKWDQGEGGVLGTSVLAINGIARKDGYFTMATVAFVPSFDDVPILSSFCVSNPNSFGYVKVKNSDPFEPLEVKLNLLDDPLDVESIQRCVSELERIHNEFPPEFQLQTIVPGNGITEQFVRENSQFAYHFVGGCAVGKVLNSQLQVKNVDNLRVIDSSVLNRIPSSAGPLATVYMIAEYAADKLGTCYLEQALGISSPDCAGWLW